MNLSAHQALDEIEVSMRRFIRDSQEAGNLEELDLKKSSCVN